MVKQTGKKTRLLIVSTDMHVGGVTTALLSLLNALDKNRFQVDLLLYNHNGPLQGEIPAGVCVLPPAQQPGTAGKYLSPGYVVDRARAIWYEKVLKRPSEGLQIRAHRGARYARRLEEEYDLAISFIEFWPLYYVADYVKARHKMAWIHVDYAAGLINVRHDECVFPRYDHVVLVAKECLEHFRQLSPRFADKGVFLPNLMSTALVRSRGAQPPQQKLEAGRIKLVTVARMDIKHKGQDRAVRVFDQLRREGKLEGVVWYMIGDGEDMESLRALVKELGREQEIILLGSSLSPLPLVSQCDAFVLPSYLEGKPIAATEAQMLGLPLLLTEFASARSVTEDGVDGLVVENSEAGLREGLLKLCETPGLLEQLRENTRQRSYGNENDIEQYYDLWARMGVMDQE